MKFLKFVTTHILVLTLVINTGVSASTDTESEAIQILKKLEIGSSQLQDITKLTDREKSILTKAGLTDQEIAAINLNDKDSLTNAIPKLNAYIRSETDKATSTINKEVIPGFASSITSMAFASFLGITLITKCRAMPSALVFSGTSALWIASELSNWNGYQIKIQNIDKFGTPNRELADQQEELMLKIKVITARANKLEKELKSSIVLLREIRTLEDVEKIKDNTDKEKIREFVTEVLSLKDNIKVLKAQYKIFFDEQYLSYKQVFDSIDQIKNTTKEKARNTNIAATGFALSSALAFAEHFNLIKANGACFAKSDNNVLDLFINTAHASDQKDDSIDPAVANLDKIGIIAGVGLGAAYVGFKMKFLDKILASGMSRGVIFGIMSGVAYFSGYKLKEFTTYLDDKLKEVEELRLAISERLHIADKATDDVITLLSYVNLTVIPFIKKHFKEIDVDINVEEVLEDIPKGLIQSEQVSFIDMIMNTLFQNVVALKPPQKGNTSCYVYANNFIKQDLQCLCSKTNSCITYNLPDIEKSDSKISTFLGAASRKYVSNINGYLNGHGDVAMKNLNHLTKKQGHYESVSEQILAQKGQEKEKVKSMIKDQVKELLGSIPNDSIKNSHLNNNVEKLTNIKEQKEQPILKEERISKNIKVTRESSEDEYEGQDTTKYNLGDIHKKEELNLFDIISKRYGRHYQLN